ncbi:conserved hypothetical protein [Flavobacterium sp. 9AF]|uniref:hypothetical protein n=1 Tax=Flavobacterium sp. 9AF TaxID=2653142 RepID=UPI0012F25957|nr:hypothetical protein [Flavobacterium sp. 9AF]VXB56745.1 conserved hypothetical protein [Flavobacterium sp. 9AF]
MIQDFEKEIIIKYLGKQPSRKIIPILNKKKIFNIKGKPYSPKSIQNIINGKNENRKVETQIIKIVEAEKRVKGAIESFKKDVLGK